MLLISSYQKASLVIINKKILQLMFFLCHVLALNINVIE